MMLSRPEYGVLCAFACGLVLACDGTPRHFVSEGAGGSGGGPFTPVDSSVWGVRFRPPGTDSGGTGATPGKLYFSSSLPFFEEGGSGGGPPAPALSLFCGDGVRDVVDPITEECDDGIGSEADLCTERCQVSDTAVVPVPETVPSPQDRVSRNLGESRHPVSASAHGFGVTYVESHVDPPIVGLSVFDPAGDPRERIPVSTGGSPVLFANPVVAALPSGDYAAAWTDFDVDGAVLGVALRRVTPAPIPNAGFDAPVVGAPLGATLSPLAFANERTFFSQLDADMIVVGDKLIVAWTDSTQAETAPDIRYRTFSASGAPGTAFAATTSDRILSATTEIEGNVALSGFGTTWAAAWRSGRDAGDETIKVSIGGASSQFSIGPHLAGPVEDHPALAELDVDHLLVLYSKGTDPDGTGIANVSRLRAAVIDRNDPGAATEFDLPPADPAFADPAIAQSHPNLVRAGDALYAAWRSAARTGEADGENVFLRSLTWDGNEIIVGATELHLPRWPEATAGDQRFPALASGPRQIGTPGLPEPAPLGALVTAWDDYGQSLGVTQGRPDVLVQQWPLPVVRFGERRRADCSVEDPCGEGEGHCDDDSECQAGLDCLAGKGPQYGLPPSVSVCVPTHCTNGIQDSDETDVDCGGTQCGTCLCGDGIVFAALGEDCDDAGESATCDSDCTFVECGDGLANTASGELCDVEGDSETCDADCTLPACGDGHLNAVVGELCDDGNASNTDACPAGCLNATCGDGFLWASNEVCDDGNASNTDACTNSCQTAVCGDGFVRAGVEACDDGNASNTDACLNSCQPPVCGDGIVWAGVEACDTAGASATCNVDCTLPPNLWNPANLSPVAWYYASPTWVIHSAGAVAQWSDRTSNNRHISNPNSFGQPIYNATGWNGSQPTVTFNGSKILWREPWEGPPAGDDQAFTVLAVMRSATSHDGGVAAWWDVNGGGNTWCQVKKDHGGETVLETLRMDFITRGQLMRGRQDLGTTRHVVAWRFSPEEMKLTVDGTTTTLPQDSVGGIALGTFMVGATSLFGTSLFQGDISELVIVPTTVSDFDVGNFRAYARQTWTGLPTGNTPPNPCTTATGQNSESSKACDDGNPATYGDRCVFGVCTGTVPLPGSPAELSPAAWYVASRSEITLDGVNSTAQWFDRSGQGRFVTQVHPTYKPPFAPTGWNESKPTIAFASNTLRKNSWSGAPEGHDTSFTLLAVMRSAQVQNGGPAGWGNFDAYYQIRPFLTDVSGATRAGLHRQDDFASHSFTADTDLKTERHVVAWRYSPEVVKITVDGTTATSPNLISLGALDVDTFLVGVDNVLGFNAFRGEISELAVIPSSIDDQALANFRTYAQATWGGLPACGSGPGDTQCGASEYCDRDGLCKTRPCNLTDPFISLTSLFPTPADGIAFSADRLTAYVSVGQTNIAGNLHYATRANTNSAFGTLTPLPGVNVADERGPWLSYDGRRIFFSSTSTPTGDADLFVATRPDTSSNFGSPQMLPTVNYNTDLDKWPSFGPEEQALYFSSQRPAGHDLYFSALVNGVYSTPQIVPVINSASSETHPVVSRDGLRIYFRSSRTTGSLNDGDGDIYLAQRASPNDNFGAPVEVAVLNTSGNEFPVALSPDECSLYIATNRHTGMGGSDSLLLYEIKRGTPSPVTMTVHIVSTNPSDGIFTAPFNCTNAGGTCVVQRPYGTVLNPIWANRTAYWIGGCRANGAPGLSTDGVVSFTIENECTVQFQ